MVESVAKPRGIAKTRLRLSSREAPVDMAAMDLLVADCTILISGRPQVVKCRRHYTNCSCGAGNLLRKIRMTFEADETYFGPRQHLRICGPVGFVTRRASRDPHRSVFICEWTPKIRMAVETARFVRCEGADLLRQEAAVGIVAAQARHGVLRQAVRMRLLECGPNARMALDALLIDRFVRAC
jgi:hypothetical protein